MPTLVIDLLGKRKRVKVSSRASIGRVAANDVPIDHPAISRTHAMILCVDGTFFVEDAGSANGTLLNGRRVRGKKPLKDGAQIEVGPAIITFHGDDAVIDTAQPERQTSTRDGILLNCSCGAQLWVPEDRVGSSGKCRQCGAEVVLGEKQVCSVCQWEITADAEKHRCPECGLAFHAECWKQNLGCSAYGCPQVNVLADPRDTQVSAEEIGAPPDVSSGRHDRVSWETPLLTASIAASLLGILFFGSLALLVAILATTYLLRNRGAVKVRLLAASITIASLGLLAGIAVSGYWWLGWTLPR